MNRILTFTLCALILSAPALAQTAKPTMYTDKPIGAGDPNATSCYPLPSSMSRVKKMDCRPNSEWAQISASNNRNGPLDIGNKAGGAPVNVIHN